MIATAKCEHCGRVRLGSRFRDGARVWLHVCGGCKARITLSDPARVARPAWLDVAQKIGP